MAAINKLNPIPHPPKKPVVGNMLSLDPNAPVQHLVRLTKELGPIFWLDMMGAPLVIVSGHDLIDELSDEKRFDKAVRGSLRRVRAVGGDGLFTADTSEPNWSKAHNILLQPFGNRAMASYHAMMVDIASQLAAKWDRLNSEDEIDVARDMTSLTLDTIGICGFDYRFNSFYREGNHPFVRAMVNALSTAMAQLRRLPLEHFIRRGQDQTFAADIAFMNQTVDRIVQDRRENKDRKDGAKANSDLLNSMLEGVDRKTGERLDDLNIRYQIITFLIAGHETTSGLLSFAVNALVNHPEVLERAYAEVDRVLGPDPSILPTSAQVNQLNYITQILKETLRLWPTAPAFSVHPYEDTVIGGKHRFGKSDHVLILLAGLHRDRTIWGDQPNASIRITLAPRPRARVQQMRGNRSAMASAPVSGGSSRCMKLRWCWGWCCIALG